jgi:putative DNA-invertase from lambdoid prophage Rac
MSRTFAYCRVSTADQTATNQIREIEAAGFKADPRRIVTETVSGASAIQQRKGFMKLLDKLDEDDVLIVTKMDRLGRNAIDVKSTIDKLTGIGVRVHCLQLGGADLTSAAGKMIMGMLNTFAEFERDLLIERTQSGMARAKAAGKQLGRQPVLTPAQRELVRAKIAAGESVSAVARCLKTSRMTIARARRSTSLNGTIRGRVVVHVRPQLTTTGGPNAKVEAQREYKSQIDTNAPSHTGLNLRNGLPGTISRHAKKGSPDDLFKTARSLMSVFKAAGRDNALTGFADVGNSVTAAHGKRRAV